LGYEGKIERGSNQLKPTKTNKDWESQPFALGWFGLFSAGVLAQNRHSGPAVRDKEQGTSPYTRLHNH
jgi:hypothetical protein